MANTYVGARREIAFSKESTRGTRVEAQDGDWQPHNGFGFDEVVQKIKNQAARGRIEMTNRHNVVHKSSEGPVELDVTKDFIGEIFTMIFGQSPVSTGPVGDKYTHPYLILNDNCHQSYSITVKDPIAGYLGYPGVMLDEVTLDFVQEDITKASLSFMGGAETAATPGGTGYSTDYDDPFFVPDQLEVKIADDVASLSGEPELDVNALSMVITKGAQKLFQANKEVPKDIVNTRFDIGGTIEEVYENTLLRDLANARAVKAMQIKIEDSDGNIVTIVFPRVGFETADRGDNNDETLTMSVAWFIERDDTDGWIESASVVDKIATH